MTFRSSHLLTTSPPWILWTAAADPLLSEETLAELGIIGRVLHGTRMRTKTGMLDEFASQLAFPDYFGRNWDGLADCLADLGWLHGLAYVVVIDRASQLLVAEPSVETVRFVQLVQRVASQWAQPVSVGEDWDRPAIPFHLLLHDSPDQCETVRGQFDSGRMAFPELAWGDSGEKVF